MRRELFFRCVIALWTFAITTPAWPVRAQSGSQPTFRLDGLKFSGLARYADAQVSSASGLRIGDLISVAQLQAAADRLSQSGAFDKVSFRYLTKGNLLKAEFQVTETADVLPCFFDNFIWFSRADLDATMSARIPFYDGAIPLRGTTASDAASALQALLQAHGVKGTVENLPFYEKMGGPVSGFSFRVNGVPMPVRDIHFPGAAAVSERELVSASSELIEKDYSAGDAQAVASLALLALYHRRGYLRAHFDAPQASLLAGSGSGPPFPVSVTIPVVEGLQYAWADAAWTGNRQFSSGDLDVLLAMKPKEVANQDKIDVGLIAVRNAYAKRGYIDAVFKQLPSLDDTARLARYDVAIDEGLQYHMGQLRFEGLSDKLSEDLARKWKLFSGQVYDGTYADEFIRKDALPKLAELRMMRRTSMTLRRNSADATVDLVLAFQ